MAQAFFQTREPPGIHRIVLVMALPREGREIWLLTTPVFTGTITSRLALRGMNTGYHVSFDGDVWVMASVHVIPFSG